MNEFENKNKVIVFDVFLSIVFLVIISRFFYIQIYMQEQYFEESERNRIREIVIKPLRGLMFDRKGEVLVDNRPAYSVYAFPFALQKADTVYPLLCKILEYDSVYLENKIKQEFHGLFRPIKIKRQVDFMTLSQIEEYRLQLPGISYQVEPKRYYPSGVKAPHVFGYLAEITKRELELHEDEDYALGDLIGKKGLEKQYEAVLRGKKGVRFIEVDVHGREIRSLTEMKSIPAKPGSHLILGLDADLQRCVEAEMDSFRGGVVVIDVRNGDVLALASKPDYDLDIFTKLIPKPVWHALINDPEKPLYDRMLQSLYPPGSTYKLVLAVAALEENIITADWTAHCPGFILLGWRTFDCWKGDGHGELNLLQAIEQSCNVYFYKLGLKTGLKNWADYGRKFGFGYRTGIDIKGENGGLVPDEDYLNEKYGKNRWSDGLLLNLAVGQGDLLVTPIQMAVFAMAIANEGVYYRPHIVKSIQDAETNELIRLPIDTVQIAGISKKTFGMLKAAMYKVVHGSSGTGRGLWLPGIQAAGKTGTAQNPHGEDHAWFIGFAPFHQPEIAFCVLVENGGSGGTAAVPIARTLLKQYFSGTKFPLQLSNAGFLNTDD